MNKQKNIFTEDDGYETLYKKLSNKVEFIISTISHKKAMLVLVPTAIGIAAFLASGYLSFIELSKDISSIAQTVDDPNIQIISDRISHLASMVKGIIYAVIAGSSVFALYHLIALKEHSKIHTDNLTGVKNRHFLEKFWANQDHKDYVSVQVDIDHFKKINDTYGHDAGDIVIKDFASSLSKSVRAPGGDHVIRMGGEEFLILIKHNGNPEAALNVVYRMQENIRNMEIFIEATKAIKITCSFGVNMAYHTSITPEESIKRADKALYLAKRERNKIEIFTDQSVKEYAVSKEKLFELIRNGGIVCIYQPIVNLATGETIKYEALARIQDENGLTYTPQVFFNIMSGTELEFEFVKQLYKANLAIAKSNNTIISINLTSREIMIDGLLSFFKEDLEQNPANVEYIELELSDSESIVDISTFEYILTSLRSIGFKISIDKFGAKYSQILHLIGEIDEIKIDGNIIKQLKYDEKIISQIKSMITLAKNNGVKVSAGHIESFEIQEIVSALGVEMGQGYYLGRPGVMNINSSYLQTS